MAGTFGRLSLLKCSANFRTETGAWATALITTVFLALDARFDGKTHLEKGREVSSITLSL